ncbi:MAG: exodeoxyribonuclease V subunit gamma [Lachnospiraceae bacterium]|nr:exodeoxyribonuclease V subunit gamma [Lachnospiraceae bacterium]
MALRFILGSSGAGKTRYVYDEIIQKSIDNPGKNYIIVVPEQFTMAVQKDIVELHPRHGVMNIDIVSFNRLAFRIFEELGINRLSILDDTGKTLVLRHVIEAKKEELKLFKDKLKYFGFVEEMKSSISELYQYGIAPDELKNIVAESKGHRSTMMKLEDISVIYEAFREYVKNMSGDDNVYITKEEVLSRLCDAVPSSDIIRNSELYLDGFTGFTPVQNRLVQLLMEYSQQVHVTLTIAKEACDGITSTGFGDIKEHELFAMSKTTVNTLMSLAADSRVQVDQPVFIDMSDKSRFAGNEVLAHVERQLFRYGEIVKARINEHNINNRENNRNRNNENKENNHNKENSHTEGQVAFEIYQASNSVKEAEFTSDKIVSMVMESKGNLRYRDIAVITGDLEGVGRNLERALKSNGIPYFMDGKRSLIRNPFVNVIRGILQMADEDFSYESVFAYLKNDMSPLNRDEADILENYVLGCGVRGFKDYSNPFTKMHKDMTEEDLAECESIRIKLMNAVSDFFEKDIKAMNVRDISNLIREFTVVHRLSEKLDEYEEYFKEQEEHSLAAEYSQAYELTMELFDKLDSLLGDEKLTLKEYRRLLDDGFDEIKVGIIPMVMDQVVVGDIQRTRLKAIKVLFVMGVNDGIIPSHGNKPGLLSQSDRTVLKNMNMELSPTVREAGFIQRFYLYLNLTKPSEKLILTYALSSADGNAMRPSYLIGTMQDMFEDCIIKECEAESEMLITKRGAFEKTILGIKDYETEELDTLWRELFAYFGRDDKYREALDRAIEGAYYTNADSVLDKAVANALYGDRLSGSITRIERYAACAYAHFLSYGLKLMERPVYEIKPVDIGNIFHEAIELFSRQIVERELDFASVTDDMRKSIVDDVVEQVTEKYGGHVLRSSARNSYMIEKIRRVTDRSAWAIIEHIRRGGFKPDDFELKLREGRIDRVDRLSDDGNVYIKVIDYKSGNTTFNPADVENGLQLQLIYYMDTLVKREKALNPGKGVHPGGVFYFNIKDPIIDYEESMTDEDVFAEKLLAQYKMTGAINSDEHVIMGIDSSLGEDNKTSNVAKVKYGDIGSYIHVGADAGVLSEENFERLIGRVKSKIEQMTTEIMDGNIAMNPYKKGQYTPCSYCKFKGVCAFDNKQFKNEYRRLHTTSAKELETVWSRPEFGTNSDKKSGGRESDRRKEG